MADVYKERLFMYNIVSSILFWFSFGLPIWYLQTFYARFKTELVVI
jgi:hypothetical protein